MFKNRIKNLSFDKGDFVRVTDGTFVGHQGAVLERFDEKETLIVELSIFGRSVPVELEFSQVDSL